jgi:hypothetical protein
MIHALKRWSFIRACQRDWRSWLATNAPEIVGPECWSVRDQRASRRAAP